MKKIDTKEFIRRAIEIHGNNYDYSLVNYAGSHDRVKIICKKHGIIEILPFNHLNLKRGCKSCGLERTHKLNKVTTEELIARCPKMSNYTYENISFAKISDKIELSCKIHGAFTTTPANLLKGGGCRKCRYEKRKYNTEEFITKAKIFHNESYSYEKSDYISSHDLITITCPLHGDFVQKAYSHIQGAKCPKCSGFVSNQEIELSNFIKSLGCEVLTSYRKFPGVREVDIYLPSHKLAFEYNGLYWHSNQFKVNNYHVEKTETLNNLGIDVVQIFDDEWQYKKEICKSRIENILNMTKNRIYARNTELKEVSNSLSRSFLMNNHLQGFCGAKYKYGLFYKEELVSIMTFGFLRKSLGSKYKENQFELIRFCNKINHNIIGGASKIFKYFIKTHCPDKIISYSDRRWSNGHLYENLQFDFIKNTKPNYFYTDGSLKRMNRFKFAKHNLVKMGFDSKKTENQITKELGLYKIYDCGHKLYIYNGKDLF